MITAKTAMDIALAYREIDTAEKLLADVLDAKERYSAPDIRDAFGRRQDGLQLGVPSGQNGHRLFNVPWSIVQPVIELHIAHHRARIATLNAIAAEECSDCVEHRNGEDREDGLSSEAMPARAEGIAQGEPQ